MIERYSLLAADSWAVLLQLSHNLDLLIQETKYRVPTANECRGIVQIAIRAFDTVSFTCSHLEPRNEISKPLFALKSAYLKLHQNSDRTNLLSLSLCIAPILKAIRQEYENTFYFKIERDDLNLYKGKILFGEEVDQKFPTLRIEIENAGKCLALMQPTACVFYLMRVIEASVKQLGRKLKIPINVEIESWASIISRVNGKIDQLPKATRIQQRKKAKYAEASTYLNSIRIAWRNEVMHPHQNYTKDQARKIFSLTRDFMVHLAALM